MQTTNDVWYKSWFNTVYYHILYQNRNDEEAVLFLDNLARRLSLEPNAKIWDMACGKGRHSIYLSKKKYHAIGTDLSQKSIEDALKSQNENLSFHVHDMRTCFQVNYFDCVLNIFTSIGYFETREDDERVFLSAYESCKKNGNFVLDFMNSVKVEKNLVYDETKDIGGIKFCIKRKLENNIFKKEISFFADGKNWNFEEKVKAYKIDDLIKIGKAIGFSIENTFGNYALQDFDELKSDRLILIFKK
jgi:ubiquinone/menaquinone biosynthesis C-methylase UbiE